MNERIKLLAEQAERLAEDELAHLERVHNRLYSFTEGREIYSQKFAELIVRECIDKITTYNLIPGHSAKWEDIYDIHARLLDDLGEELKEHFGVEE